MNPVFLVAAVRTPIGRFGGSLKDWSAADLGVVAAKESLRRANLAPERVEDSIWGCARQAGGGPNVARQVAWLAGVPQEVPAATINMACASSLKAIDLAFRAVRDGDAEVVLAGGVESMSRVPYLLPGARWGYRMGNQPLVDAMYQDGFLCPLAKMLMGETAERLARELDIPRAEQDRFALESQKKAAAAQAAGRFEAEIAPVRIRGKQGETLFATDEHVRGDATLEGLAKLPPVFDAKSGTVSAGNSSGITDGAAALLVMRRTTADALGLKPLAEVGETAQVGLDPKVMGLGPVPACRALRERNGLAALDYDLVELNEAFAAQVLACHRQMPLPLERLNVNGGSIALGHPIGATGARIVVTLLHELARRGGKNGLATLCISGGLGFAAAFHRPGS